MNALLSFFYDGLRADLGYPARLIRLIQNNPEIVVELTEPAQTINASSVVRWDGFGHDALTRWERRRPWQLMGWRMSGGHFESFHLERPEFDQFAQRQVEDRWECDITAVDGFSASKSDLKQFTSTDQMVETNSRKMIDSITPEKLAKNLAHDEIRIIHSDRDIDYFARFAWDGRLFLMNSGGSHHFAAAKYIAARLEQPVPLTGALHTYSLNEVAVASLRRDFELFVISDDPMLHNEFFDAMKHFEATWLWTRMPEPYTKHCRAILLPRTEGRSMRAARALREAGAVDLGKYLAEICARQVAR